MASSGRNISDNEANVKVAADVFAKYGDFIYNVIRSKTSNKAQVDDLYQNFFLSLVSNPISPDSDNIKGYLYRAITNDIIDASRHTKRYQKLINNYSNNFNLTIKKTFPTDAINNSDEAERVFQVAKGNLSPTEMKAFNMRYEKGCSNEEIAEEIGAKKESISRYICVGLKKLRQLLAAKGDK